MNDANTSVMPTPLAYSRSSSMTSLNSFDAKSVHSSVASEYSHRLSNIGTSMRRLKKNKKKLERINSDADEENTNSDETEEGGSDTDCTSNDEEDIDIIMPDSPAAPADSSFLMTQRIKHKQQQMHYRQTAAAAMYSNGAGELSSADPIKLAKAFSAAVCINKTATVGQPQFNQWQMASKNFNVSFFLIFFSIFEIFLQNRNISRN